MKGSFVKLAVFLVSIGLVGCSTNTRQENTAIGAVSGAVIGGAAGSLVGAGTGQVAAIGVGAIAGALIGGSIGHSMDSSDDVRVVEVMNTSPTHKAHYWRNKKTGNKYKVVAMSEHMSYKGHDYCRKYHTTAIINGKKESISGVACRTKNGKWKSV